MHAIKKISFLGLFCLLCSPALWAQAMRPVLDVMLSDYAYPFQVDTLTLQSQQQTLIMAYMDIHASRPNGKTVVLLHGKNFNGAYWKTTVEALTAEGYRVVVPDQIGFGKSSKPIGYQFSFQQLALNTKILLDSLQLFEVYLLGHSMGGMLATRFALMYPNTVKKLILENPIGLEDWKVVAPYTSVDTNYQKELQADYETTKTYQLNAYYDKQWKAAYDEWVYLLTGWVKSPDYPRVAMNNAQTSDMIFTQPVVYEFKDVSMPTLLIIGTRDRTAIGRDKVQDPKIRARMGQYQVLGKQVQRVIPNAKLIELEGVGHLPHIESFERFISPLLNYLAN
ncbi:alpha/beta fold hydrolase [Sphingobacterium suaedae]|uniref:Alpha/beta fold hydrolase n=1 Tax=Sphingobacterium suaedae TaxID=1686402 RepID=A0ABW5KJJ5_9SPHI